MGFYKQRQDYNQAFAEADPLIAHDAVIVGDEEGRKRRSFFRINDEEELNAACANWIHMPVMVMVGLQGGYVNKGSSIRQLNLNSILFLTKMSPDPENPVDATAITNAYDITFDLMKAYIKKVNDDFEDDPCGPFKDIDLGKFKWEQVGPINDNLYGWILTFSDETRPNL